MSARRTWFYGLTALVVLLLALLAWNWRALSARAALGAAYGARVACSCRYVEGRDMPNCQGDKEPGMAMVSLSDHPDARAVSASVPLIASRIARYRPGWGCLLDPVR
jgi:hypothetical protein